LGNGREVCGNGKRGKGKKRRDEAVMMLLAILPQLNVFTTTTFLV
jgi:hypothetical protein